MQSFNKLPSGHRSLNKFDGREVVFIDVLDIFWTCTDLHFKIHLQGIPWSIFVPCIVFDVDFNFPVLCLQC